MSRTLFALAVICLVAAVQADPSYVEVTATGHADCSGDVMGTNFTAGDCKPQFGFAQVYYFDSTNVYYAIYKGDACNSTTLQTVSQIPIGCNTGTSFGYRYRTYGATSAFTFPPTGFAVATTYYNVSASGAKGSACSAGNGINAIQQAYPSSASCVVRSTGPAYTAPSSQSAFCADNTASIVTYSDTTCTSVAFADQTPYTQGCQVEGNTATQGPACDGAAPSGLPTHGWTEYDNAGCTSNANTVTHELIDTCFDRQMFSCAAVNGTDAATLTLYTSSKVDGACETVLQTITATPGTCVPGPNAGTWRKYSCDLSPQGGAASVLSVSVATVVAAILAVFATRAL